MISDSFLKRAVLEAYGIISEQLKDASQEEKEKQQSVSDDIDDEGIRKKEPSKTGVEEESSEDSEKNDNLDLVKKNDKKDSKFSYEIPDKMPKNIQFKDILVQLNALRSGASTKDAEVKQGLLKYFDNLKSDERQEFFSMMSGFATIMNKAGDVEDAPIPDDVRKPKGKGETTVQPIKKKGNTPIVVGESAKKLGELMVVLENTKEKHRCTSGKLVPYASPRAIKDIEGRITDASSSRNTCARGSEARSHYNGLLKYLRMQLRAAQKINGPS